MRECSSSIPTYATPLVRHRPGTHREGDHQGQTSAPSQESTAAGAAFLTQPPQRNCDSRTTSWRASCSLPAMPTWSVNPPMYSVPAKQMCEGLLSYDYNIHEIFPPYDTHTPPFNIHRGSDPRYRLALLPNLTHACHIRTLLAQYATVDLATMLYLSNLGFLR